MVRSIIAGGLALFLLAAPALSFVRHGHHVMKAPKAAPGIDSSQKFLCFANPAGWLVCIIAAMIVIDEVKRSVDGPNCATMKPRRSWFGMTPDEPRLWRPLCSFDPASSAVISK